MFYAEYWMITVSLKVNIMKKDMTTLKITSNKNSSSATLTKYLMDLTSNHSDGQIHLNVKLGFFLNLLTPTWL